MTHELPERERLLIARALADPRRSLILSQIGAAAAGLPCSTLVDTHEVSAATISHHLKELEAAGLIEIRREGKTARLRIRRDRLRLYAETIASL